MSTLLCPPRVSSFELEVLSDDGNRAHLRIEGRLVHRFDAKGEEPLVASLGFEAYRRSVMIDLSDVTALATSGLSWLLLANKRMQQAGGKLVLHSLPPAVRNVVRVLKVQSVLTIAEDRDAADALLTGENS